jgi:hypothetical protein
MLLGQREQIVVVQLNRPTGMALIQRIDLLAQSRRELSTDASIITALAA